MRQTLRHILLPSAVLGLIALLGAPTLAGAFPGHGPRGHGHGEMHGFMGGFLAEDLELSDAQREEISGIMDAAREEGAPLWEQMEASRQALKDATTAEPFDENAVRAAAAQMGAVTAEMAIHRAGVLAQVRSVLTPEQQARADELHQSMEDWRGFRQERGPRGHHRRHGF
jgi:Spy/CpxP family protein refolding chaperone